jgi:hypothetical protein
MPEPQPDTQVTPQGATIPVPKRGEFDANLDKLLKAPQAPAKVLGKRSRRAPDGRGKVSGHDARP